MAWRRGSRVMFWSAFRFCAFTKATGCYAGSARPEGRTFLSMVADTICTAKNTILSPHRPRTSTGVSFIDIQFSGHFGLACGHGRRIHDDLCLVRRCSIAGDMTASPSHAVGLLLLPNNNPSLHLPSNGRGIFRNLGPAKKLLADIVRISWPPPAPTISWRRCCRQPPSPHHVGRRTFAIVCPFRSAEVGRPSILIPRRAAVPVGGNRHRAPAYGRWLAGIAVCQKSAG